MVLWQFVQASPLRPDRPSVHALRELLRRRNQRAGESQEQAFQHVGRMKKPWWSVDGFGQTDQSILILITTAGWPGSDFRFLRNGRKPLNTESAFPMTRVILTLCCCLGLVSLAGVALSKEWKSGIVWSEPAKVEPGATPSDAPSDAVVLFDGTDLSNFEGGDGWTVEDGAMITGGKGGVTTKQKFGDCQLHIEWASPSEVKSQGQGRGNSGVHFMGEYEVQILDSYDNETYFDGQCASIYKQYPPLVNATRPPGEWQTYDIIFTAPRFYDDRSLKSPAYFTVIHNGVVVQNHVELQGATYWHKPPEYNKHDLTGPIHLQNHGNPVRFRNIWVREIQQLPSRDDAAKG